ncbi:MAG: hypothetical protein ACFE8P_00330, partial [Promethearchaeota archaeon]
MVVHDHGDNNRMGLIANALVNDDFKDINRMLGTDVQEGYYDVSTNLVHRCVPLNAPNGKKLEGRFKLVDGRLIDRGEIWFEAYRDRMVLTQEYSRWQGSTVPVISLEYYRTISYSLGTRFVALLQEVNDEIVSVAPFDDHFKGSTNYRTRIDPNRFLNPDYDPESQEAVEAREFFDSIKELADLRMDAKNVPIYLPISENILNKINDGIGFDDLDQVISKLLSKPIAGVFPGIDAVNWDQDNFVYELFSTGLSNRQGAKYSISHITFRGTTEKEMFSCWFEVLNNFDSTDFDLNDDIDARIHRVLFDENGNNKFSNYLNGFSAGNDYSEEDLNIVKDIVEILSYIMGRFGFLEMYRGRIFLKYGCVSFISRPWVEEYRVISIFRKINFHLFTHRSTGLESGYTDLYPGRNLDQKSLVSIRSYHIFEFLTDFELISSNSKILGVSSEIWSPQYKNPVTSFTDRKEIESLISLYIFSNARYDFEYSERKDLDANSLLYNKLHQAIIPKIKSRSEYGYVMRELGHSLLTAASKKGRENRRLFYDWFGARGNYPLEFVIGRQNAKIIFDKSDFDAYFAPYMDYLTISLSSLKIGKENSENRIIQNINFIQDFIIDLLDFINRMAQSIAQRIGGSKIVLYPFSPNSDGWGYESKDDYYGIKDDLIEIQGEIKEWRPYEARKSRDIGFVFDPNNPDSFEELLPEFLGLLLIRKAGFVVRAVNDISPNNPNSFMENRECAFLFDIIGGILPNDFKYSKDIKSIGPGKHINGLIWKDELLFLGLYQDLMDILNKHKILYIGSIKSLKFYDL